MVTVLAAMRRRAILATLAVAFAGFLPGYAASAPAGSANVSLAVLPFTNASGDASQDSFVDGMTDEISATLARIDGLHVGARTSAFRFKGQSDTRVIGQALSKTHVVQGSVNRMGDGIRLSARLVKADDGQQLWSEAYDRKFADIFEIEEDIAQHVASTLNVPLGLQPGDRLVQDRTTNMAAYENYVRAKPLIRARGQKPFAD